MATHTSTNGSDSKHIADQQMQERLDRLVAQADLNEVSGKQVRRQLEQVMLMQKRSLNSRRAEIDRWIESCVIRQAEEIKALKALCRASGIGYARKIKEALSNEDKVRVLTELLDKRGIARSAMDLTAEGVERARLLRELHDLSS